MWQHRRACGSAMRWPRAPAEAVIGVEAESAAEAGWLAGDWVVPGTVEGVNALWERHGLVGWTRGQEPDGWDADGNMTGTGELGADSEEGRGTGTPAAVDGGAGGAQRAEGV